MRKARFFGVLVATGTLAAVPLAASGGAGAQDAGDCGSGGVAAAQSQTNAGGLLGALIPINLQVVLPVNAPILSPNAQTCNRNENEVNVTKEVEVTKVVEAEHGGGGGGHPAPAPGPKGAGAAPTATATAVGIIAPGGAATPIVVAQPRFTG